MRRLLCAGFLVLLTGILSAQSSGTVPRFEIADVHASSQTAARFARLVPVRNGRYEIRAATMVDLIRFAWNFETDRILGGPNWLELDRFDVIAKVPPDSPPDAQRSMLQSLLKDRFELVLHEQTKPVATWVLSAGKKPQLKEADGSGETGCKLRNGSGPPPEGGSRIAVNGAAINLGAGATIQYACRNMTMAAFAEGLRTMMFSQIPTPVLDRTGLQGTWNFDVRWSLPFLGPMAGSGERITVVDALEKQLGLKLEQTPVSQAVLVVDSVNRQPSDNPPGIADALPATPPPTEFEVADVKLVSPDYHGVMRFQMLPSGRFLANGMPLRFLINRAFNTNNNDQIAGLPGWVDTVRVDITAKAPAESVAVSYDPDVFAPMLRALLMERFGLAYHTEQRPVSAYSLVAAKPKMKKADPQSRIFCRTPPPSPNIGPDSRALACQNATMVLLAESLQNLAPGLTAPVQDATGLEGGWDFTLTFSPVPPAMLNRIAAAGDQGKGAPVASDPAGGYTIFESIEKHLGLKLEAQKRTLPVIVIDRLQPKPTEN